MKTVAQGGKPQSTPRKGRACPTPTVGDGDGRQADAGARRNQDLLIQAVLPVFFLAAGIASAAIDGTVTNGTTGKPQPGATITLYKLGENGLESVESVKSDAAGKFRIDQNLQGPRLLQSAYDGVTYNHMLPPNAPTAGVALDVYNASKEPGGARVMQHMVVLEPKGSEMAVEEIYVWLNAGKTTFYDPTAGALKFYAPPGSKGIQVNCTAPQGQPIRRAPQATSQPDVYSVDFPIKPGESNIDMAYVLPFTSPGVFEGKVFYKGGPTSLIVPTSVQLKGEGIESRGPGPSGTSIYQTTAAAYKVNVEGTGELKRQQAAEPEQNGPQIQFVMPKLYNKLTWVLALSFSILALGFTLLYRSGQPAVGVKKSGKKK